MIERSEFIQLVDECLQETLSSNLKSNNYSGEILYSSSRHLLLNSDSKKARPWLTCLFGSSVQASLENTIKIAAAAEMVHTASLLHDDVIDDGDVRRGEQSVNSLHGNTVAVLSGDLLLTEALQLLYNMDRQIKLWRTSKCR